MASDSKTLPVIGVLFAVASIGAGGYYLAHRSATVHFINALDEPVHISVGELDFDLNKDQQTKQTLPKGPQRVRVAFAGKEGKLLEEATIDVPGGVDCAVYNVAGAAPLYRGSVTYTSRGDSPKESFDVIGGQRFYWNDHTQYCFVDPPKTISLSKGSSQAVHHMVAVAPKADWIDTLILLAKHEQKPLAVEVATRVALLHPDKIDHVSRVIYGLGLAGLSEATPELARQLVTAAPHSIEAHRFYQSALESEGKRPELIAEYQRRLEADPTSPEALYLLLRVLPRRDRLPRLQQAVGVFPDDPKLHYSLLVSLGDEHKQDGADAVIAKLKTMKLDDAYRRVIEENSAQLAVEAGRGKQALASLDPKRVSPLFVARLQKLVDKQIAPGILDSIQDPMRSAYANLYLEGEGASITSAKEENPVRQQFLKLTEVVRQGRAATIAQYQAGKVDPGSLSALGTALVYPFAAALAKHGATKEAMDVVASVGLASIAQRSFMAIVLEGKDDPELEEADRDSRAALRLALAIHTTDKARQKQLIDGALRDEPIPGPIHLLAKSWF